MCKKSFLLTIFHVFLYFLFLNNVYASCEFLTKNNMPSGVKDAGIHVKLYDFCPTLQSVNLEGKGKPSRLYNGLYFTGPRSSTYYENKGGHLVLNLGGAVATVQTSSHWGQLPLLSGKRSFYVEVTASISDNDPDHWPAIWMMPIEHNLRLDDVYNKINKPGYEQWMELDIDEGGFGPGVHNTAISWQGKWPGYSKVQNLNTTSSTLLDRTIPHTFGVSYDSKTLTVKWWLDGNMINQATTPSVPEIARDQLFYLIVSAQTHKLKKPYQLTIYSIRAYQDLFN